MFGTVRCNSTARDLTIRCISFTVVILDSCFVSDNSSVEKQNLVHCFISHTADQCSKVQVGITTQLV